MATRLIAPARRRQTGPETAPDQAGGAVVSLDDPAAADPTRVGAKAANLARARQAGLPVLPGFVLTPAAARALQVGGRRPAPPPPALQAIAAAWTELSERGRRSLVVRSSSEAEDGTASSMAGLFVSVVDVRGWTAFVEAVQAVAGGSGRGRPGDGGAQPAMAVLVQPYLDPARSGVLFGLDPVTGRTDRRVVSVVAGGPQALVGGTVAGSRYLLSPRGHLLEPAIGPVLLERRLRRALLRLARRAEALFGGPQDMEWAMEAGDQLWLLQSRPVTAAALPAVGPVLGPGPLAETFPDALCPLEESLWAPPLRRAVVEALRLAGTTSPRRLADSPVLVTVGGRMAVDLDLLGARPPGRRRFVERLDPRPGLRRLGSAWRVGRLRAALPGLGVDLIAEVDAALASVPALPSLEDDALLGLLHRAQGFLSAVHGHEMLAGLLVGADQSPATGAGFALRAVAEGRAEGRSDEEIVAERPEALALTVPAVGPGGPLPPAYHGGHPRTPGDYGGHPRTPGDETGELGLRETLRLRARWLHELTGRAAWELGRRLAGRGVLSTPGAVRHLSLDELEAALRSGTVPQCVGTPPGPPLPAAFRLTAGGAVVALGGREDGGGRGASAGRRMGPVHGGPEFPSDGDVLVVPSLDPRLAPVLPRLAGLVAETGSELSHLAILAREYGVPTVVGVEGAVGRFPPGTVLLVDGTTGEVTALASGTVPA